MNISHLAAFIGIDTVSLMVALLLTPGGNQSSRRKIEIFLQDQNLYAPPEAIDELVEELKRYFQISDNGDIDFSALPDAAGTPPQTRIGR